MSSQWSRPSAAEREAQKVFKQPEANNTLSEYERDQNALRDNLRRLRAERLRRESAKDAGGNMSK
jgi:hypothetical protein